MKETVGIEWDLKIGEGFEDLSNSDKRAILESIAHDILQGETDGSLGIEEE